MKLPVGYSDWQAPEEVQSDQRLKRDNSNNDEDECSNVNKEKPIREKRLKAKSKREKEKKEKKKWRKENSRKFEKEKRNEKEEV